MKLSEDNSLSSSDDENNKSFFAKADDPLYVSLLYGAISGTTVVAVGHPLDSIKVRLQTGTTTNIFRNLYKGVLPPFFSCCTIMDRCVFIVWRCIESPWEQ